MSSCRLKSPRQSYFMTVCGCVCALLYLSAVNIQAQDNQRSRGFYPAGSYSVSDIESINVENGNLMFSIPMVSLPTGRGGSPGAGVGLFYNSKVWDTLSYHDGRIEDGSPITELTASISGGWRYGFHYDLNLIHRYTEAQPPNGLSCSDNEALYVWKVRMTFPDGSEHIFRPLGYNDAQGDNFFRIRPDGWWTNCNQPDSLVDTGRLTYYTVDGTYLRLDVEHDSDNDPSNNPWTLYFSNGARVTGGNAPQRIYDRNGNYTEVQNITYNAHPATKIIDQLGRYIIVEYGPAIGPAPETKRDYIHAWRMENGQLTELVWTIKWRSVGSANAYYANPNDMTWGIVYYSPGLIGVDEIVLPAQAGGLSYKFTYNSDNNPSGWGEVSSMTLPSGAQAKYQFTAGTSTFGSVNENILHNRPTRKDLIYRPEYDMSSAPNNMPCNPQTETCTTETRTYAIDDFCTGNNASVTIVAPDGGTTRHYSVPCAPIPSQGYKTELPDGSVVERIWQNNVPYGSGYAANPYIKTEFTTVRDFAGNLSKTAIKDYNYDKNGNVTRIAEYDWVPYGTIQHGAYGIPIGIPAGAPLKKVTTNAYYSQTPDASNSNNDDPNVYHKAFSPHLRNAIASSEVGDGVQTLARSEFTFDNPTTTGNLTEQRTWDSTRGVYSNPLSTANSISVSHLYDTYGNRTLSTDPRGYQTQFNYGSVNGFASLYPTEVKTAYGTSVQRTATSEYDFYTGASTRTTDADNNVSSVTVYDVLGRPILVKAAEGKPEETRTSTEYSDTARRVIVRSDLNIMGDGKLVSIQHYDQLGRVRLTRQLEDAATQSATDESIGIKVQTRCSFSGSNSYQLASNPYRAATSSAASAEATMGWTRSKSDNGGRVVEVETFSGSGLPAPWGTNSSSTGVVTPVYDANYTTVTDQAGKVRRSMMDGLGRLARVDEPDANNSLGNVDTPVQPTSYAYDALGNLTQVTQGAQSRSFSYSSLSRLIAANNPESGAISYEYDANGNLTQKVDARSVTTSYLHDPLNRATSRSYSGDTPAVTYTYDTAGVPYAKGKLTAVTSSVSITSYGEFDALGRIRQSSQTTDGQTYQMSYGYNVAGGITSQTYPSGRVVTTSFDNAGRLSQISGQKTGEANKTYASSFSYTAHGAVGEMKLGNNLWEHTIFNNRLQPLLIGLGTSQAIPNPQDINRFRLDYSYGTTDNNGNVLQQTISVPDASGNYVATMAQSYTYDELNRLKSAQENGGTSWKQTFIYDRFGNRTFDADPTKTTANALSSLLTIDQANNRFTAGQGSILYDNAGNLTREFSGHTFGYDGESKQVTYDGGSTAGGTDYKYDGDGRRIKKVTGTGQATTIFVYDAMGQMLAEYDTATQQGTGGTSFLTSDTLGTPRLITDSGGAVKARHDYLPFGEEVGLTGGRTSPQGYVVDSVNQKFTRKERDIETGLDYFGARYYGAAMGRFTSVDPLLSSGDVANPQSWNRYAYTYNNPINLIDVFGLFTWGDGAKDENFRKQFRAWLKDIEKARDGFKSGSKEYDKLNGVLKAYGEEGKGGPSIRVAGTTPDGRQVGGARAGGEFKNGKLVSTSVTFNPKALDGVTAFDVGHEGTHIVDFQKMADGVKGGVAGFTPTDFDLESNAVETEQFMGIGLKANHSVIIPSGDKDDLGEDIYDTHYLYKTSWGAADEATLRNARNVFLEKSTTYKLSPEKPGKINSPSSKPVTKRRP